MDPWHGKCPDKLNPLKRISNIVERYHLKKDEEAIRQTECVYKEMKTSRVKKYQLEERLSKLGRFHSSKHRGVFLCVLLDTKEYERCCKNCGKKVEDLTQHGLKDCSGVKHQRVV